MTQQKYALLSVSDKTGLVEFAQVLIKAGFTLLSTGGTKSHLEKAGVPVTGVSDYTQSPEVLDGRVKTLHPKIHGGLLARTSKPEDLADLQKIGGSPIPVVVVNLYPFLQKIAEVEEQADPGYESLVEFIDIGGPAMLRASAKNFAHVTVITDAADYERVENELTSAGETSLLTRRELAAKVFKTTAEYDLSVARYLALGEQVLEEDGTPKICTPVEGMVLERTQTLRYGENPHQEASLYSKLGAEPFWVQLQGKELSYNNLVDLEAALELALELEAGANGKQVAVIIKHTNPCGAALRDSLFDAFIAARACDPVSAFGGIIAVTGPVDKKLAESILEGFVEVIIAPKVSGGAYSAEALQLFQSKKNIRLLEVDYDRARKWKFSKRVVVKNFFDQLLFQQADSGIVSTVDMKVVCEGKIPFEAIRSEVEFAWRLSKHVKSNAIVLSKELQAVGVGAGQMSRLDSARISLERAKTHGFDPKGAIAASDAFLPFPDTLEVLSDAGIIALVQPGGSLKDDVVIEVARKRGVTMIVTGERHFRH